jgi:hypothetical protein
MVARMQVLTAPALQAASTPPMWSNVALAVVEYLINAGMANIAHKKVPNRWHQTHA